ncbi:hypothetical protein ABW19_dt0205976 [Dactylella cylindrospora]|nr:hypothetical protein ABW19_dt0205976 [Dactylella cylindrospora]
MKPVQSLPENSSHIFLHSDVNTMTSLPFTVPNSLLLLPGYGILTGLLEAFFDPDFTNWVIRFATFAIAVVTSVVYMWNRITAFIVLHYTSNITIDGDDMIHVYVMKWLTENINTRTLQAKTMSGNDHDVEDQQKVAQYNAAVKDGQFHLVEWQKFSRPDYQPHLGDHYFTFCGRTFWITRFRESFLLPELVSSARQSTFEKVESIRISCWGHSAEPVKEFIQEAKRIYLDQECSKTTIFRPKIGHWTPRWARSSTRPSRPMDTVILDEEQKKELLNDVNQFLHPDSPRWYALHGIPYRRGYLLYGPPGTGKSSLTFALGGLFGLGIYCLSLGDPAMTDEKLLTFFGELPRRCIVLIEDIDTMEISKKRDEEEGAKGEDGGEAKDGEKEDRKSRRPRQTRDRSQVPQNSVSLSGLLNAIDGVATHEGAKHRILFMNSNFTNCPIVTGRILIMTTNHPDGLDPALIREGRVDKLIGFRLATRTQIVQLFINMYTNCHPEEQGDDIEKQKISDTAEAFANLLPEGKFSPAEIQGFLLVRRGKYKKALDDVREWRNRILARREEDE